MDYSPCGSSVCGIFQVRLLEWIAIPFSRGSSQPRDQTRGLLHCKQILYCLSYQGSPLFAIPKQCQTRQSVVWKCKDWKEERLKNNDLNFHLKKLEKEQELKKKSGRKEILNTIRESNKLRNTERKLTRLKAGSLKILIKFISSQQEKKWEKQKLPKSGEKNGKWPDF